MRLSPFHCEISKRIAQGQKNKDIMKEIQISASRLSVLKANPLMKREIAKWQKLEEDKYKKALDTFADSAQEVAEQVVLMVKNPVLGGQTRLAAAKEVLDRTALTSDVRTESAEGEDSVVFEQLLRVTKRGNGASESPDMEDSGEVSKEIKELQEDFIDANWKGITNGGAESQEGQKRSSTLTKWRNSQRG